MSALRHDSLPRRLLAATLCVTLAGSPVAPLRGDAIRDAAEQGRAAGREVVQPFGNAPPPAPITASELFQVPDGPPLADFTAVYGNDGQATSAGIAGRTTLRASPSPSGEAYRAILDGANRARPDMRSDPIWRQTDEVRANFDALAATFSSCTTDTAFADATRTITTRTVEPCERAVDVAAEGCRLVRNVTSATRTENCPLGTQYTHLSGERLRMRSMCTSGPTKSLYWHAEIGGHGSCSGEVRIDLPRAQFTEPVATPTHEVCGYVGGGPAESGDLGTWECGPAPIAAAQAAGLTGRSIATSTANWKGPCTVPFTLVLRSGVQGCANGTCNYRFFVYEDRWGGIEFMNVSFPDWQINHSLQQTITDQPPGCSRAASCTASDWNCTAAGPRAVTGESVGASWPGIGTLYPGDTGAELCWEAQANRYQCDGFRALGGQACVTSADETGEVCAPWATIEASNQCAALEADPDCGFLSAACVEGFTDPGSGRCLLREEKFECLRSTQVPTVERIERLACDGPVRCMGEDCVTPDREQSTDFARAAAYLQAAQFMAMDTDGGSVFSGEPAHCKVAVAGIVDCCNGATTGVSLTDYITLAMAVGKLDAAAMNLGNGSGLRGAWETLRTPFTSAWDEVTTPFTSVANSIIGNTAPAASEAAASAAAQGFQQQILRQTAQWTADTFGTQAANSLFSIGNTPAIDAAGHLLGGEVQLGGALGSALSWVMTAYTIYQVAMILIQLIWQCKQEEFELQAKRELRTCHDLGSYCAKKVVGFCLEKRRGFCCFNSPLSRIMQQQIRPQLAMSWGTPEAPSCEGLFIDDLAAVNWEAVDLDEWVAILHETGNLPTPSSVDVERLTGLGSRLNIDGGRPDAIARTVQRSTGIDSESLRLEAQAELIGRTPIEPVVGVDLCTSFPDHPSCPAVGTPEFCALFGAAAACTAGTPEFCGVNPTDPSCIAGTPQYCALGQHAGAVACEPGTPEFCAVNASDATCFAGTPAYCALTAHTGEAVCQAGTPEFCSVNTTDATCIAGTPQFCALKPGHAACNSPPTITVSFPALAKGAASTITYSATDPDGDGVTVSGWLVVTGLSNAGINQSWPKGWSLFAPTSLTLASAPPVHTATATLTVTATDSRGATATRIVTRSLTYSCTALFSGYLCH